MRDVFGKLVNLNFDICSQQLIYISNCETASILKYNNWAKIKRLIGS
jgi:hypothetical protein